MNLILLDPADFVAGDRVVLRDRRHAHVRRSTAPPSATACASASSAVASAAPRSSPSTTSPSSSPSPHRRSAAAAGDHPRARPAAAAQPAQGPAAGHRDGRQALRAVPLRPRRAELLHRLRRRPARLAEELRLGLEQARDTVLPAVEIHPQPFHRFLAEVWPTLPEGQVLIAHPEPGAAACPRAVAGPHTLVVGPEGGFVPAEVARLRELGTLIDLGPRILRVETAIVALLARLS
jgi:16S rRNA (uracil1498-N3)-methyltransferase